MLQHADPGSSRTKDKTQDTLRHEVEQIIAQRLERSHLKKAKPATLPSEAPAAPGPALRRRPLSLQTEPDKPVNREMPDPASGRPSDLAAFDKDFSEDVADEPPLSYESAEAADDLPLSYDTVEEVTEPDMPQNQMEFERIDLLQAEERQAELRQENLRQEELSQQGDRRQGERRNMEFLRTELQWSSSPEPEEKRGLIKRMGFRRSRFTLLALALVSAAVAGGLALTNQAPPPEPEVAAAPPPEPVVVPTTSILIATQQIGAGEKLTEASLGWHEVPVSTLLPGYISAKADPEAIASFDQTIARYPFFPGDPIRADKLLDSPRQSLAAVLASGMRGISVPVSSVAAAGGFIKPDDHVDVVLTSNGVTRTVLEDVRVLAVGDRFGPSTTGDANEDPETANKAFNGTTTAILELDPTAAEVLARATATGSLTLTLRPPESGTASRPTPRNGADQTIRLTSAFWNDSYSPTAK